MYFNPRVKCCTFVPVLPNFLVGRILRDSERGQPQGRASVEARIATGIGVTPLGLGRSPAQHVPDAGFGQDEKYLCPHFVQQDGGICSIWQHREAVCATFFCKFVRGAMGANFWGALRRLLEAIEQALAWQCVETLDVGAATVSLLLGAAGDARHDTVALRQDGTYAPADLRAIWGRWAGRERAFYEAAAGSSRACRGARFSSGPGPRFVCAPGSCAKPMRACARRQFPRDRFAAAPLSPPRSTPPPCASRPTATWIRSPFRGRSSTRSPTSTSRAAEPAIAAIEAAHGLEIDLDVVGRLVDFQVLVPAPKTTDAEPESSPAPDPS